MLPPKPTRRPLHCLLFPSFVYACEGVFSPHEMFYNSSSQAKRVKKIHAGKWASRQREKECRHEAVALNLTSYRHIRLGNRSNRFSVDFGHSSANPVQAMMSSTAEKPIAVLVKQVYSIQKNVPVQYVSYSDSPLLLKICFPFRWFH